MAILTSEATDLGANQQPVRDRTGLKIPRYFSRAGVNPYDEVEWELRTAHHHQREG